jgi:competence ComEA-like helix-hairpin-helix protein
MSRVRALVLLGALALLPSLARVLQPEVRPSTSRVLLDPIDLNSADAAALEVIPGVGPALARRIVDDRERNGAFPTIEAIERVHGIGKKKREAIGAWVRVSPSAPHRGSTSR